MSKNMKHPLFILFFCLFVVMTGYGLTLPVLPYYIERLAVNSEATTGQAAFQVGLLTGVFSLMQFLFAPLWGKWSDRTGRRPLFLIGLIGFALSMILFALGTNLIMLYTARIIGGILSAAVLPIAGAFVADMTSEQDRARGMAWLGSATSLGVVLGPALGAFLSKWGIQRAYSFGYFRIDDFSIPFFSASILAFLALGAAIRWFPESLNRSGDNVQGDGKGGFNSLEPGSKPTAGRRWIGPLLALAFLNYFALAIFEGTFALHAKVLINFGAFEMGWIFMVCGLVMAVSQGTLIPTLIGRFGEIPLLPVGFIMMSAGLVFLMRAEQMASVLVFVALFALGVALITPTLASMVSKWAGSDVGKALGQLTAANSLGQAAGPMVGGIMIGWQVHVPYLLTALFLGIAAFASLLLIRGKGA
ncbi:MAG: MFS transporter [Deltaproteobacteria bacterium]|nr:MFS transporter [Deltaproteobacteria bacterium]